MSSSRSSKSSQGLPGVPSWGWVRYLTSMVVMTRVVFPAACTTLNLRTVNNVQLAQHHGRVTSGGRHTAVRLPNKEVWTNQTIHTHVHSTPSCHEHGCESTLRDFPAVGRRRCAEPSTLGSPTQGDPASKTFQRRHPVSRGLAEALPPLVAPWPLARPSGQKHHDFQLVMRRQSGRSPAPASSVRLLPVSARWWGRSSQEAGKRR